jgi:hypothetical protein
MKVIYRICDVQSPLSQPPPVCQDDRQLLNITCLKSFVKAFKDTDISIHFILDNCEYSWEELLRKFVNFTYDVIRTGDGINGSCRRAVDMALKAKDDIIFQECDYLWRPNTGKKYIEAIKYFGFVSPYDHPDKYPGNAKLELCDSIHYRTAVSTTQTYGVTKEELNRRKDIIYKHGYIDHAMWVDLGKVGVKLRTPIPSFATHMVHNYMAPSIDWKKIFQSNL